MKKQIFISCLIVAFFNYINGCSVKSTERITPEQLSFNKETIEEAVLLNFDVIKFDDKGAVYKKGPDLIIGKLIDNKPVRINVDYIKEFRTSNVQPMDIANLHNQKIKEILLKNDLLISTDNTGAKYNKETNSISGKTDTGQPFEIKVDKISKIFPEKPDTLSLMQIIQDTSKRIAQVLQKKDNTLYVFDKDGGRFLSQKKFITGFTTDKELVYLDPDSVLYLNVERTNVPGTILANLGLIALIAGGFLLILLATKQSCPFIYSFDGEKYVFDAEPLGGATTKGLERTEYSRMEYLSNSNGEHKILVRNEVEETQYLDELTLLAVEHDADKEVIPDLNGNFYQIKNPILPLSAMDEKGQDLLKVVSKDDNLYWQTKLPVDSSRISTTYRHQLTFKFPRPKNKVSAKLIVNIGTTLWGSRMIREMLQLYGNYVDEYYKKIDEQKYDYQQMMNFIESEELYRLKYYTNDGVDWKLQGFINGGGPLISETRVYDLDLTNMEGDTLSIKLNPPYGFWTIDYIAVQYDEYKTPNLKTIPLTTAVNQDGLDLKDQLKVKDNNYVIMPTVGDYFEATFSSLSEESKKNTSYYLKSNGYYEIHVDKTKPFQLNTLTRFVTDPGFIVRYSNEIYSNWKKQNK